MQFSIRTLKIVIHPFPTYCNSIIHPKRKLLHTISTTLSILVHCFLSLSFALCYSNTFAYVFYFYDYPACCSHKNASKLFPKAIISLTELPRNAQIFFFLYQTALSIFHKLPARDYRYPTIGKRNKLFRMETNFYNP